MLEGYISDLMKELGIQVLTPNLCISPTDAQGFSLFKEYIIKHVDPFSYKELSMMDKWWISALMHSHIRFKNLTNIHLGSFQAPNALKGTFKGTSFLQDQFDYSHTIREVLEASRLDRTVFMLWISVYGTGAMLDGFISAGIDLHEGEGFGTSYLGFAARAQNFSTFQVLLGAGARTKGDMEAFRDFLSISRTREDDIHFIEGLVQQSFSRICTSYPAHGIDEPFSYLSRYFMSKIQQYQESPSQRGRIIAQRFVATAYATYSHPPYHRSHYLGPDVLRAVACRRLSFLRYLVEMEASLDYIGHGRLAKGYTALQIAVELGYVEVLEVLLSSTTGYADRRSALLRAYPNAISNIATAHPRRAQGIDTKSGHWGYGEMELRYWESYGEDGGASYKIDLQCHSLIWNALKDLGVEAPFESQEGCVRGADTGCRSILSKFLILYKLLNTGRSRIQAIFYTLKIWS